MSAAIKDLAAELAAASKSGSVRRITWCSGCAKRGIHTEVEPTKVVDKMPDGTERTREFVAWGCSDCVAKAERDRERRRESFTQDDLVAQSTKRGLRRHPSAGGWKP